MKVSVYLPDAKKNPDHKDVLTAFCRGLGAAGYAPVLRGVESYHEGDDLAVVFGIGKHAVVYSAHRQYVIEMQKKAGARTIVLEKGYLFRDQYWAAGFDGINGHADFRNANCPTERLQALPSYMEMWRNTADNEYVLLCGQVPWDASVQDANHLDWICRTLQWIKDAGYKPLFRSHPRHPDPPLFLGVETSKESFLEADLARSRCVITFNSNTALDALWAGVPAYCADEGAMCWGHAPAATYGALERLDGCSRVPLFSNVAYAQWTLDEMAEGLAARHLLRPGW